MSTVGDSNLHWSDIVILVAYFLFIVFVGLWSSFRGSRDTVSGYFLASRNMIWPLVGASIFASNIGSGHFVGLAGSAAASGIAVTAFENNAILMLVIFGWVFTPIYMASGVYTTPEYMSKRFGGHRIRVYLSCMALVLSIFTKISVDLFSGAIFINMALGWNLYLAICLLLAIAAVFTMLGGLTAVVWTDFVQTILMIIGSFILMILAFHKLGGFQGLVDTYMAAEPNITLYDENGISCGKSPDYAMHIMRSVTPGEADFPWTGMLFGNFVSGIWYWSTDQVIVQRILAAKSMYHAKASTIFASYLKFLPMFLMVFPGMAAKALFPNEVGCVVPEECFKICGSSTGCTNVAYPTLVLNLMPNGLRGLMMAVMMAALMSSLTSIFNSSATLFALDIWARLRKNSKEYEKLLVGRLFVLVMVAISILWIPVINSSSDSKLFDYIQSIQSYLCPPIAAIYTVGMFSSRITEQGGFWSLILGLIVGCIRFGLEFGYPIPSCGSDEPDLRPEGVKIFVDKIHYLHFGCILYLFCILVAYLISVVTTPIEKQHLYRLIWWNKTSEKVRVDLDEEGRKRIYSDEETVSLKSKHSSSIAAVEVSTWRRALNCLCGFDTTQEEAVVEEEVIPISKEEEARLSAEFVREKGNMKTLLNAMAVIVLSVSGFIWGFFA